MPKTLKEIAAEQLLVKKDLQDRQVNWLIQKKVEADYQAAWDKFINACFLNKPDDEASQAITELAKLLRERNLMPRLQEVALGFESRPEESYVIGILIEAYNGKADGKQLNEAREWMHTDLGLTYEADNIRGAVRNGFSPPPKPEIVEPLRAPKPQIIRKQKGPPRDELDEMIRVYIAKNQNLYDRFKNAHLNGKTIPKKTIVRTFGSRALGREFKVSHSRISKSKDWQKMAGELGLKRETGMGKPPGNKIGLVIAEEKAGIARGDTAITAVIRSELAKRVNEICPKELATEIIGKLEIGDYSEQCVEDLLETYQDQERQK